MVTKVFSKHFITWKKGSIKLSAIFQLAWYVETILGS